MFFYVLLLKVISTFLVTISVLLPTVPVLTHSYAQYSACHTVVEIGFTPNNYLVQEGETAVLFIENRHPDMETEVTVRVEFTGGTATGLTDMSQPASYFCYALFNSVQFKRTLLDQQSTSPFYLVIHK